AKVTWEAIQKIELCNDVERIWDLTLETSRTLGCDMLRMSCHRQGRTILQRTSDAAEGAEASPQMSGPTATFRLPAGHDLSPVVSLTQARASPVPADIGFRFPQRLALAPAERLERLLTEPAATPYPGLSEPAFDEESEAVTDPSLLPPSRSVPA